MERESIPFLIWGSEKESREYSEKILGPMLRDSPKVGAVLELNDVPVAEQECRMSENFCVIPEEQSKTLTISAMGEGPVLKLTKRKARLLAEIILDLIQTW